MCSWWLSSPSSSSSSSSTMRLLVWLIVPLVLISGILALFGPRASNFSLTSNSYQPWLWTTTSTSSNSSSLSVPAIYGKNITTADDDDGPEKALLSAIEGVPLPSQPPLSIESTATAVPSIVQPPIPQLIVPSMNDSHHFSTTTRLKRNATKLEKLEAGLHRARTAIKQARDNQSRALDGEFVPQGPMYRSSNAFLGSYLEMEKHFKVYVYEEGEPPLFHTGPCKSIYAMEGNFISLMEVSKFRTRNPDEAHAFFLPFSVTMMVRFVYERDSHNWAPMKQTVSDYIDLISRKYQYWNRSLGADHFMLSCHDWGPELSKTVPYLFKNSIRALCNANTSEGFNPSKDVSFPEILLRDGTTNNALGGPSASHRPILVFFAGGVHGPIRPILLEHWEDKDEDVQVHKYLPKGVSYTGMMRKSRFCICASGYEVASPRMVEAIYMGCVPVLIKDGYVAPFSDVMNWKSFAVEVATKDIPNLKNILMRITSRQYIRMQRRGVQARRHFEVNMPPERFDVFHMILHSIWLRRLNIRLHDQDDE